MSSDSSSSPSSPTPTPTPSSPSSLILLSDALRSQGVSLSVFTGAAGAFSAAGHHLRFDVTRYFIEYCRGGSDKAAAAAPSRHRAGGWFSSPKATAAHNSNGVAAASDDAVRLLKVEVDANSLSAESRVSKTDRRETLGPLGSFDKKAIDDRTRGGSVLESSVYGTVAFTPHGSTLAHGGPTAAALAEAEGDEDLTVYYTRRAAEGSASSSSASASSSSLHAYKYTFPKSFSGNLTLKGVTKPITCTCARERRANPAAAAAVPSSQSSAVVGDGAGFDFLVISCPFDQTYFDMKPFSLLGGALAVADRVDVEVCIPRRGVVI